MTTLIRQNAMTPHQWEALLAEPCDAVIIDIGDDDGEEVTSRFVPDPSPAFLIQIDNV
jgi:hypothetical protein